MSPLPRTHGTTFDLRFVPVAQIVDLIYQDAIQVPYVLGPDLLSDARLVSFRLHDRTRDIGAVMSDFFDSLGFEIVSKNGVDYVRKKAGAAQSVDRDVFVYKPRFRKADYLREMVAPLVENGSSLEVALRTALNERYITADQAGAIRAVDSMRDAAQHWMIVVSEDVLYLHARALVTVIDDILQGHFDDTLADNLPMRVLPISTHPIGEVQLLIDKEYRQIRELLAPGKRAR